MKHILYVRLTKTHDVATVFVFASEMVKWKLCTIRLAVVSCQWFPHYVNLFYLNTLLHSTSAVPFLSSSWNLYLHTTAPLPTHSFTLHLLINKCVCNKYLLTTYKVPGQDGRQQGTQRTGGLEIFFSSSMKVACHSATVAVPSFPLSPLLCLQLRDVVSSSMIPKSPGVEVKRCYMSPAPGN